MSKVTNYEYFKDEIIELVTDGDNIALRDGRPVRCGNMRGCDICGFSSVSGNCCGPRKAWLNAEHIEKPKLTKKERQFCELVETGWIARDCCGHLNYRPYDNKPHKDLCGLNWKGDLLTGTVLHCINVTLPINFSFITWDDKEPWSVEELLKLEYEQ